MLRLKKVSDMKPGKCHADLCGDDSTVIYASKAAEKFRRQNSGQEVELCDKHVKAWNEDQEAVG